MSTDREIALAALRDLAQNAEEPHVRLGAAEKLLTADESATWQNILLHEKRASRGPSEGKTI